MAVRELIVSGYVGSEKPHSQVDPFLQRLLGKFVDELKEDEKLLYEYTQVVGLGDLWLAFWDETRLSLTLMASSSGTDGCGVSVPHPPVGGPATLLPALYELSAIVERV